MILFPAIDLKEGQCVRLQQGDMARATVFHDDPAAQAKQFAALFEHLEKDYGVERGTLLGLWGIESAFGDPLVQKNHMRPVIPSLATLAWGEPRRRTYWESELINALTVIQNGWSTPAEMNGSWAGAMGHTP